MHAFFQMNVKVQSTIEQYLRYISRSHSKGREGERKSSIVLIQDLRQSELGLFISKIKNKSSFEMISNRENHCHQKASSLFRLFLVSVYYCVLLEVKNLLHDKSMCIYNEIINGNRYYKSIANS